MTRADDSTVDHEGVTFDLLGWPPDGPKLRLDHRRFSYAGKFVMTNTGKAVARDETDDEIVAAASFNADRTDDDRLWIRYVTVARERRGEGIGPGLAAFVRERAVDRGYDRVRIAVNNPFAYEALYRAGFAFIGETTGIAELVLEFDAHEARTRSIDAYRDGLEHFADRDLAPEEASFLEEKLRREPPEWRE